MYPLKEFDILTRIGPFEIDNEGMTQAQDNLRLWFTSQVPKLARGGTVPITVLRDGKMVGVDLPVRLDLDRLIRSYEGRYPSYFICGPLVFSPALSDAGAFYFRGNPSLSQRNSPQLTRCSDRPRFPGEELVVVTAPLLRTRMAKGYTDPFGQVVSELNGTKVRNLAHLVELIRSCKDEYLTFRFYEAYAETLVFRRKTMLAATEPLMAENGIPRRGSEDMLSIWEGKSRASHP